MLVWLVGAAQNLVINVGGEEVPGPEAVIMSWEALRNVFQTHQIHSRLRSGSTGKGSRCHVGDHISVGERRKEF